MEPWAKKDILYQFHANLESYTSTRTSLTQKLKLRYQIGRSDNLGMNLTHGAKLRDQNVYFAKFLCSLPYASLHTNFYLFVIIQQTTRQCSHFHSLRLTARELPSCFSTSRNAVKVSKPLVVTSLVLIWHVLYDC